MNATIPPTRMGSESRRSAAPRFIRSLGPLFGALFRLGIPVGPNTLLTVRGRNSGQPRTTPVAVVEAHGRRWIMGAYGDVQWVRNLRAAGRGIIQVDDQPVPVQAAELSQADAEDFFRNTLLPYVAALPRAGRALAAVLFRLVGSQDILGDPVAASQKFPVFELNAIR